MTFNIGVITLLPEMFSALDYGISGRALKQGLVQIDYWNPRTWSKPPHCAVDDKPYGGGPGMVMLYEPLNAAIQCAKNALPGPVKTVYLSPQGQTIQQAKLNQVVTEKQSLLLIAGRYEGIDERIITQHVDEEWSIGEYVLSGGELAAMVCIDALIRLLPNSVGDPNSVLQDSFMEGLLDHPHYTRPACIDGMEVPPVLLSGSHREIDRYRRKQMLGKTWLKRPDLLEKKQLNESDVTLLNEFKIEYVNEKH